MAKANGNTYLIRKLDVANMHVLEKNGKPVWLIPDELVVDISAILAKAEKKTEIVYVEKERYDRNQEERMDY